MSRRPAVPNSSARWPTRTPAYHRTFSGTNTGPGGTGKAVGVEGYEQWTIDDDGVVAASSGYDDEAEYARLLEHGV